MSWTDEEIDQLVNDAAASQKVSYNKAYWDEMNAMLNSKPAKKGTFWWSSLAVVLVLTSVGIVLITHDFKGADAQNNLRATNEAQNSSLVADSKTKDLKDLKKDGNVQSLNSNTNSINNSKELNASLSKSSLSLNQKKSNDGKANNKQLFTQISGENLTNRKNQNLGGSISTPKNVNQNGSNRIASESNLNGELEASNINNALSKEENNEFMNSFRKLDDDVDFIEVNVKTTKYKTENKMEIYPVPMIDWYTPSSHSLVATAFDLPIFPRTRIGFYAEMKAGIGQSYVRSRNNNTLYQVGVNAGLEYFKNNWTFGVGLGIRQQFINNLEVRKQIDQYSFGLVRTNQQLNYDQMVFVDLPISVSYQFNRSAIGLIVIPTYLLGSRLSYSMKTDEFIGDKTTSRVDNSESKTFVSSDNFQNFGCNIGVSYSYSIFNNLSIAANLSTRINGTILKTDFENNASQFPILLEVGLKKRF